MVRKSRKKAAPEGSGMLYFCASPIGNLQDITLRVLECLKTADYLAVENKERSLKLLSYYDIHVPLLPYREAGRAKMEQRIIDYLQQGKNIALLSDAGMPAVSDPGHSLAQRLREHNIPFTVLPGPSASLAALLLSGFSTRHFVFWGFLSKRKQERTRELEEIAQESKTGIIYEAPHRLVKVLEEMADCMPKRELAVCRELTKQFEEVRHGFAPVLLEHFEQVKPRGEITIVVSPLLEKNKKTKTTALAEVEAEVIAKLEAELQHGTPPSLAVKNAARTFSLERRTVYALLLKMQGRNNN